MFDFISNFFNRKKDTADTKRELDQVLELANAHCRQHKESNQIESDGEDDVGDMPSADECFLSKGKITALTESAGMINRQIPFVLSKTRRFQLNEGDTVSYLWYRQPNGAVKVVKIVEQLEENWNQPVTVRNC